MAAPRTLLLWDEAVQPSSWNERMVPGEYAVHYSSFDASFGGSPVCTVLGSLTEAKSFARDEVIRRPELRCRIYDHQGLIGAPIAEFRGGSYKPESDISPRFRRWVGSFLFFGGLILTAIDWRSDFQLSWPAMLGTRMIIPGLILLFTEVMVIVYARRAARHAASEGESESTPGNAA